MLKIILSATLALASIQFLHASDLSTSSEIKNECAKVKNYALLGKKYYDQQQYSKALTQFKEQAAWTSFCLLNSEESGFKFSSKEVEIANNNVGLTYAKLGQPQWARAWFLRDENAKSSAFNLSKLPAPLVTSDWTGTYVSRSGFGQWDYITVRKNKKNYSIEYEGYYFGAYGLIYGPNMGQFDTSMPFTAKKAVYHFEDCKIDLNFDIHFKYGQIIKVSEKSGEYGCGFGFNVSSQGTYLKVETVK